MNRLAPVLLLMVLPGMCMSCRGDAGEEPTEAKGEPPARPIQPTGAPGEYLVRVNASDRTQATKDGTLIIYGFNGNQLKETGRPGRNEPPHFVWYDPSEQGGWPREAMVTMPDDPNLRFFAALDNDGDGRLSPGEHLGHPRPLDTLVRIDGSLLFHIAGPLPPGKSGEAGKPPTQDTPAREGAGPTNVPISLTIEATPDAKRAGTGAPMLFVYERRQLNKVGLPKKDEAPSFFWSEGSRTLRWPLSLDMPLPQAPRLVVIAGLDLDGDGRLSTGDYFSEPVEVANVPKGPLLLGQRMEGPGGNPGTDPSADPPVGRPPGPPPDRPRDAPPDSPRTR